VDTNVPPSLTQPSNQVGVVGLPVTLAVVATDGDGDALDTPPSACRRVSRSRRYPASSRARRRPRARSRSRSRVNDGTESATASFTWTITDADPLVLDPMPQAAAERVSARRSSYTATARNGINTQYRWYFDDGSETGWSSSPSVTPHVLAPSSSGCHGHREGRSRRQQTQTFSQLVHLPLTSGRPAVSSGTSRSAPAGSGSSTRTTTLSARSAREQPAARRRLPSAPRRARWQLRRTARSG
jgi:hypothetical protein